MASSQQLKRGIASVVRRVADRNRSILSSPAATVSARGVHASAYDKNPDDQARPGLVPDDVISEAGPATSWAPHPSTGVFGPADGHVPHEHPPLPGGPQGGSVLDQKAWFRPLEDVDKPLP
ncbi:late embryogenesis abundant protein At5g17165-like [Wolffia australiana]